MMAMGFNFMADPRPIPRPWIRLRADGRWSCTARPGPNDYPADKPGYAFALSAREGARSAYGAWLDANGLCHPGFRRYNPDVRPFVPRP